MKNRERPFRIKKQRKLERRLYRQQHPKIRDYRLYALKLEGDHYYVGMTAYRDVGVRFQQHLEGVRGAKWTKLHKPLEIIEVREIGWCTESEAANKENLMTREYMMLYGVYRVRGGDLCFVNSSMIALHFNDMGAVVVKRQKRVKLQREAREQARIVEALRDRGIV